MHISCGQVAINALPGGGSLCGSCCTSLLSKPGIHPPDSAKKRQRDRDKVVGSADAVAEAKRRRMLAFLEMDRRSALEGVFDLRVSMPCARKSQFIQQVHDSSKHETCSARVVWHFAYFGTVQQVLVPADLNILPGVVASLSVRTCERADGDHRQTCPATLRNMHVSKPSSTLVAAERI